MANRPLRYRQFLRLARRYGTQELPGRGKGSECLPERLAGSRRLVATVTCHGPNTELRIGLIAAVRRRLEPDPAHGISDEEFYRDA